MKTKTRKLPSGATVRILTDGTVKLRGSLRGRMYVEPSDVDRLAVILMAASMSKHLKSANKSSSFGAAAP